FFKSENIVIDDESVSLIIELKGDDTAAIMTELEKLAAYALGIGKIVKKDVEDLVGKSVTSEIYDLVDAINNSDGAWVYSIIDDLYDQKKQPHEILGYLSWYMRTIQNVKKHLAAGLNAGEIASKLKYKPGYVNRLIAQAKQYPTQKIKKWVGLLLKTDSDIKTGLKPPRIALDMLIASFVGSRNKN
ncbi:MAG TPA: DNA polymerase III subunit delta, partial [Candidatus Omnitrophota bacterium]|nr:DNA polymerase III subunit delta [Candidatus Omnitrophota bacterium]